MAHSMSNGCLNKNIRNTSDSLPKICNRKKCGGYYYVPSESAEADTLKDKFWRDLEQGKLNFLNTVDMYTRVKRPGKLYEVDCLAMSNQDSLLLSDFAPVTCLHSSMPSSSVIGSLISTTDASPPSSSGYESSSIPSIGSLSVTDSPTESEQRIGGLCDLFTSVAETKRSELKRKRKTSSNFVWQSSYKSKRRKPCTISRNASKRKKTNSKFYRYVDALSEEADTLKDKFWRDLEMGNVSAVTTTDLYSSVKVSRRTRQLSLSLVRNCDEADDCTEDPVSSNECETNDSVTANCTAISDVSMKCSEVDSGSNERKSDTGTLDEPSDCHISEQMTSVGDCKLLSPCSVSVERLPFSIDDVDLLVAGSTEMHSDATAGHLRCTSAETVSNLMTEDHTAMSSGMSVKMGCKQRWHSGCFRTGSRHLNRDARSVEFISGSNTRVECVHLSRLEINRSLPLGCVPVAFPRSCQQRVICGWLEDDTIASAGEILLCLYHMFGIVYLYYKLFLALNFLVAYAVSCCK